MVNNLKIDRRRPEQWLFKDLTIWRIFLNFAQISNAHCSGLRRSIFKLFTIFPHRIWSPTIFYWSVWRISPIGDFGDFWWLFWLVGYIGYLYKYLNVLPFWKANDICSKLAYFLARVNSIQILFMLPSAVAAGKSDPKISYDIVSGASYVSYLKKIYLNLQ